jgi:hypothetical protein
MAVTRARLLLAALIVGAATIFLLVPRGRAVAPTSAPAASAAAAAAQESPHGAEMDHAMAAVLAMQSAPDGATPCETAYNAFKASKDVSDTQGVKAVVLSLAPRDEFLSRCAQLSPQTQACLAPRYMWKHRAECQRADPGVNLSGMVELLRRTEPTPAEPESVMVPAAAGSSSAH